MFPLKPTAPHPTARSGQAIGLAAALFICAACAKAQATTWTSFLTYSRQEGQDVNNGAPIVYGVALPIFGSALPGSSPAQPAAWVGAQTSPPADLGGGVLGPATDGAGNVYQLYSVTGAGSYAGYVSKTTPDHVTAYFGLTVTPAFVAVSPSGDVFIMTGFLGGPIYRLNPDGTTILAATPDSAANFRGFSVDANDDLTVPISYQSEDDGTEVFAATGPVPYLSGPIAMPGESGYPPFQPEMSAEQYYPVPYPPVIPTYTVPVTPNPTVSLSVGDATSTLPVTYQWYYNGSPINGATLTTYNGAFLGSGTYSITASTTGGTVTARAMVELTVDGVAASAVPTFITTPLSIDIDLGTTATLSASVAATLPVTFQWYFNGTAIAGAANSTPSPTTSGLYTSTYVASQPGNYTVEATTVGSGGGSLTSPNATVTVTSSGGVAVEEIPTITAEPQSSSFAYGGIPDLSVSAVATLPITYQWQLNGVNIPGATDSHYSSGVPGAYTVVVTTAGGSVTSSAATVALASRPINISTRAFVGTGANVSIAGFVVSSYSGAAKQLLIRAVGPTLSEFNVPGALAQPVLTVYDSAGNAVASNTGWNNSATITAAGATAGAFALPAGSADSALLLNLQPGSYTAEVAGVEGTTGVALVEVYEIAADGGHLINLSTRASVGTGADIAIGGFVVGGPQASQYLIRAVGPGLAQFGVPGGLAQPVLSIYDANSNLIAVNVGWSNGSSEAAVATASAASAAGAFPLTPGSADSAVYVTLAPGSYTAQVTGVGGSTGVVLIEVYQVP